MTDLGLLFPLAGAVIAGLIVWGIWPRHSGGKIKPISVSPEGKAQRRLAAGKCPDCGGPLLTGPQGGASMNVACDKCHHEFNIGLFPGGPVLLDRMGRLTGSRAVLYGITADELARTEPVRRPA